MVVAMPPHRPPNMSELAKIAGVSVSTVSRALAGSEAINIDTRTRIAALANEHGFEANRLARNLRMQRTEAIGVIIPLGHQADQPLTDPFFLTMIGHLADALSDRGYDMLLKRIVPGDERWLDRIMMAGTIDGAIIIGQSNQEATIDRVAQRYPKIVVWGAALPDQHYVCVGSDNRLGGAIATQHLIDQGRRRLLFLGDSAAPEIAEREAGFRATCDAAGIGPDAHSLRVGLVGDSAYQQVLAAIERDRDVDGIFAASDVIAIAAIRALHASGRRVPEDVAVIGFDDVPIAEHLIPALTTVRQDVAQGAELLVSKLFELLKGRATQSIEMSPTLMKRQSA